uniref:Serine/threonine/tyrosine interacting like 1 n=1 Tax=Terrapene triunguis TaxID=2587831 RepID=A0A674KDN4_9SAUR
MAGLVLCEPTELYNILNQSTKLSRLTEPNYLCLLDARTKREYNESHVITARRVKQNPMGDYLIPESVELECVKYCVVYDGKTSSLDDTDYDDYEEKEEDAEVGAAIQCARVLEQFTRHPVRILKGGYESFTACYHFLRTQKIFWMPQELDAFQPYPVEILPAQLYMGDCRQACDQQIQKDLKIKAQVNISEEIATLSLALIFQDTNFSTAVMAFLMHSSHYPLKRAWKYIQKCKTNMRPNRGFVQQLSDWESQIYGSAITDISEPHY